MGWVKLDDGFPQHPKVIGLTLEARWAYVESLCYAAKYETDGSVPNVVAANGPVRAELMASGLWESGTASTISVHDYLVYNPSRLEAEHLRSVRSRAGRASAATRAATRVLGDGVVDLASEQMDFDDFWPVYPRKVGKPKARLAFDAALSRASASEIVAGAVAYRDDPNRTDEFTAHPTTWLNRDGWADDPLPVRTVSPNERRDRELEQSRLEALKEATEIARRGRMQVAR